MLTVSIHNRLSFFLEIESALA
jgi:serine/threonine protein phosphatase PrpC